MFLISRVTHQLYVYYNSKILQKCCSSFTTDTPGSGISANTLKYLPVQGMHHRTFQESSAASHRQGHGLGDGIPEGPDQG